MARILSTIRQYYAEPMKFVTGQPNIQWGQLVFEMKHLRDVLPNCTELGQGHFSSTFELNKNWVVKVDRNNTDPAYEAWADYCMTDGRNNPWCPKIRLKVKAGGKTIYVLERLFPADYVRSSKIVEIGHQLRYGSGSMSECPECPELFRMMLDFGIGNFGDLREPNIMMRANGQLVLTDPCARFHGRGEGSRRVWDRMTAPKPEPDIDFGEPRMVHIELGGARNHYAFADAMREQMVQMRQFLVPFKRPAITEPYPKPLHERAQQAKAKRGHMHLIHQENNHVRSRGRLR